MGVGIHWRNTLKTEKHNINEQERFKISDMKKHTLSIVGVVLQCIGIGLMLYGLNNSRVLLWTAFPLVFIGLALVLVGLFSNKNKSE